MHAAALVDGFRLHSALVDLFVRIQGTLYDGQQGGEIPVPTYTV